MLQGSGQRKETRKGQQQEQPQEQPQGQPQGHPQGHPQVPSGKKQKAVVLGKQLPEQLPLVLLLLRRVGESCRCQGYHCC